MDALTTATVAVNLALGLVYVSYAMLTIDEVRHRRAGRGGSHLAYGFIAIMLTCGPHHIDHALHLLAGNQVPGGLDLVVVATGLPTGLVWFLLRLEARRGGPGDRVLTSETTIDVLRTLAAAGAVLVVAAALWLGVGGSGFSELVWTWRMLPNVLIIGLYVAIGVVLLRTQLRRYRVSGTWSLSGLGLTGVFPTCAAMHAVWVGYVTAGTYEPETHLLVIDTLAVPAAVYFLVVAWAIGEGWLRDESSPVVDVAKPDGSDEAELATGALV